MLVDRVVEIAYGAKRDFGFDMVCTHTTRRVNGTSAKAKIDLIDSCTYILAVSDLILIKA